MATYENIKLDKGMYHVSGKSFTEVLEGLDPSSQYEQSPLGKMDAYQRQLKRFGIRVSGRGSDPVEKFFATTDSAALFPEYISRAVYQGIEEANALPKIVAAVTDIAGYDYRPIVSLTTDAKKALSDVEEGGTIPSTTVETQEHLIKLKKRGRLLEASYEAIRFQKLDVFTVTLRQIGAYIARTLLKDAAKVLVEGDGNSNPITKLSPAGEGVTYADLLALWKGLGDYTMTTLLCAPDQMVSLLSLPQLQDSVAGQSFHATGNLVTPLGAEVVCSTALPEGTLIGLDRRCALEQVTAGGVSLEYDRLIDRQLERAAITCISGFAKLFTDASVALGE